jgi:hypothetical protein
MGTILKYGVALGVLVELWTVVMMATGWYKDPVLLMMFFLVIPLQITLLVVALRGTAADASYGKQVLNGTAISLIGGVIIALGSIALTTVVFPNYFSDIRALGVEMLGKAGKSAEEIEAQMRVNAGMYSPWMNALTGFIGTMATGIVVSAVAGVFLRKK